MSTHRHALEIHDETQCTTLRVAPGSGVIDLVLEEHACDEERSIAIVLDIGSADALARALRRMIREAEMRERAAETRAAVLGEGSECD